MRFAIAGADNRCYSVSTQVDGRPVSGYVSKADVAGLEEFDRSLRESSAGGPAASRTTVSVTPAPPPDPEPAGRDAQLVERIREAIALYNQRKPDQVLALLETAPDDDREVAMLRAQSYVTMARPGEALEALAPAAKRLPGDADLIGLQGSAYFLQDRHKDAKRLLEKSLSIRHNVSFAAMLARVERESAADSGSSKTYGSRFNLRFEGEALPDAAVRSLVADLEGEFNRIQFKLGCNFHDRLPVIIRTLDTYRSATGAAAWSGGHFDGRIHIAVPSSGEADAFVRETFSHELVHACLSSKGTFPTWLHEGLAQMHSGSLLTADGRMQLLELSRAGSLPRLAKMPNAWSRMGDRQAAVAYGLAMLAAETMYHDLHDAGVRSLLNNPQKVQREAERLDARIEAMLD